MSLTEFNYVVERKKPSKICFLSARERGLYKKIKKEPKSAGPYNIEQTSALYRLLNKVRSKRGVGGLADLAPRFSKTELDDTPGPALGLELLTKELKQTKFPFGSCVPRWKRKFLSQVPGPGNYDLGTVCKKTEMCQTFGGPRVMRPAIDIICVTKPMEKCDICNETCDGDYWHYDETTYICNVCMIIERHSGKKYTRKQLKKFRRIRNCSFMHQHEGTKAAIRLIPQNVIVTKLRKENYLNLFMKPY